MTINSINNKDTNVLNKTVPKPIIADSINTPAFPSKKKFEFRNILVGACIQTFEVSTLGQPFEVIKTQMAAQRQDNLKTSMQKINARGGLKGFWQGLIPWAWIEASTKGGVLLFASSEVEHFSKSRLNLSSTSSGVLGGMLGGLAQAYTTMGFCTFMKTVEVTRHKSFAQGKEMESTWKVAHDVFKKEGIRGLNRGVSAVAVRQMTNWGSRYGISRFTEGLLKRGEDRKLTTKERLLCGALACWNQPIEVIRIEMQSQIKAENRPKNLNIFTTAKYIYQNNGLLGFYRGTCMVFGGDSVKEYFNNKEKQ